jgi:hypothetical protein
MDFYMSGDEIKSMVLQTLLDEQWPMKPPATDEGKTDFIVYTAYANEGMRELADSLIRKLEDKAEEGWMKKTKQKIQTLAKEDE